MIQVRARLSKGPAFLAGEVITSCITFRHVLNDVNDPRLPPNSKIPSETLAWASAQIICLCSINSQKVIDSSLTSGSRNSATSTSLSPGRGEQGSVIFSTKPKILVCDLSLSPGQQKDYTYEEVLPLHLAPSYRGHAVRYSYKLKIGLQRVGAPVKMLHLSLRLITWKALDVPNYREDEDQVYGSGNPFLNCPSRESPLDQAMEMMQVLGSRRSPSVYKVTNSQGRVVNLCLFKTSYRLGEDVVGTLDFSEAVVSCMQYSVTLQSEESVAEEKRRRTGNSASVAGNNSFVTSYSKHHDFCVGYLQTHISLPVPLYVTPSFDTDLVALKWRLHFEFVTSVKPIDWSTGPDWKPPGEVDIETMVWDLPISIYPTAPAHVSKAISIQREATINL